MSGRKEPRKAPDSRPAEVKHASTVRGAGFKEEEHEEIIKGKKKLDLEESTHVEEEPSVLQQTEVKKINHLKKECSKEEPMPAETTSAKTCSTGSKSVRRPQTENTLSETPEGLPIGSSGTTKPTASGKAESQTRCAKVASKMEDAQPKEKKKQKAVAKKAETAAEEVSDKGEKSTPNMQEVKDSQDSVLRSLLTKLKITKTETSDASKVINNFIDNLVEYLKTKTVYFKAVEEPLRTGSYYENLKIKNPDEFDVMIPMPVERVHVEPFDRNGAFYTVGLKRGNNPLKELQEGDILSTSKMLQEFREQVKKFATEHPEWIMNRKKQGCPAVTLTREVGSVPISLDVVPCLKVKSKWPAFTDNGFKIEQWLGTKVKQECKRKPYYLVPKYEGRVETNGVCNKDAWRMSFSHIEKEIIRNHGSAKTCCERWGVRCCRKECLKLFKHLLNLLKTNPSFDKFCSYHAKTTLLHACSSRSTDSDWRESDLSECFNLLLQDFESHLRRTELYNFFIPNQNLLSGPHGPGKKQCDDLADSIKEQMEEKMVFPSLFDMLECTQSNTMEYSDIHYLFCDISSNSVLLMLKLFKKLF